MNTTKVLAKGTELKSIDFGSVLNKMNTLFDEDDEFMVLEEDEYDVLSVWNGLKLSDDVFVFRKVF